MLSPSKRPRPRGLEIVTVDPNAKPKTHGIRPTFPDSGQTEVANFLRRLIALLDQLEAANLRALGAAAATATSCSRGLSEGTAEDPLREPQAGGGQEG
jgi:hypothetical protein